MYPEIRGCPLEIRWCPLEIRRCPLEIRGYPLRNQGMSPGNQRMSPRNVPWKSGDVLWKSGDVTLKLGEIRKIGKVPTKIFLLSHFFTTLTILAENYRVPRNKLHGKIFRFRDFRFKIRFEMF